ncbi:MAG: glycosyltransferase family 4 protein, partial [Methanobacteriaceae archaeon]|nr:glycosyltransferase family 4 protein [Methanobacteriaceae archaeon]
SAWTPPVKGLRGIFFLFSAFLKLSSMVRRYHIDLIHAHFILPPGLISVLVGKLHDKKTAVTIHGSDIYIQSKKPFLKQLTRYVLKNTDYVLVVNEAIRKEVLKMGISSEKVYLTPNAVDVEKFNPQNQLPPDVAVNGNKPTLLFVGNLVNQKGVKYLLKAKKQLEVDSELLIVGDGPLKGELEQEAKGIPGVIFLGARRDVELIIPSADLMVLPSVSEGFPITILESLSSGVPVVATNVGGVAEIVKKEVGLVVEPADPKALAEAIDNLLKNDKLRLEMKGWCRETAVNHASMEIPY